MRAFRHFLVFFVVLTSAYGYAATARAEGGAVYVDEILVLTLRATVAGRGPAARAKLVAAEFPIDAETVSVRNEAGGIRMVVNGRPWILVTAQEARAAKSMPKALAESWAANIRKALAAPAVKLEGSAIKAPMAGLRYVQIVGARAREAQVASSNEGVLKVSRRGATLVIQGVGVGQAKATVMAGAITDTIEVVVQPLAAYFPQTVDAAVTGTPAARDTVAGAVAAAVNNGLQAVPNARVVFTAPVVGEIPMGESRTYGVHVRVAGPESFTSEGVVQVVVKNAPIGYRSEAVLWYCNNPERIKKPQRVFCAALEADVPVRMLYHHVNGSSGPLIMHVEAINNSPRPARVLIMPGDAEPSFNPVRAGFNAGEKFVKAWTKYSGEIVEIPPYSILPVSMRRMDKEVTVSGLCYMRLLQGGPQELIVRAEARYPSPMSHRTRRALQSPTPWHILGCPGIGDLTSVPEPDSAHIYPDPFKREEVTYTVGGPFGFVRIGQTPIARQDHQGALDGNFGVVYTIDANLENETSRPAVVELVYESSAGYSQGLFVINGEWRTTPQLSPKEEMRLRKITLGPHSSTSLRIQTVPLSGSAYPATLTIRPVAR